MTLYQRIHALQIDLDQAELPLPAPGTPQAMFEPVAERHRVEQAGDRVVWRLQPHLIFGAAALADVIPGDCHTVTQRNRQVAHPLRTVARHQLRALFQQRLILLQHRGIGCDELGRQIGRQELAKASTLAGRAGQCPQTLVGRVLIGQPKIDHLLPVVIDR